MVELMQLFTAARWYNFFGVSYLVGNVKLGDYDSGCMSGILEEIIFHKFKKFVTTLAGLVVRGSHSSGDILLPKLEVC